MCTVISVWFFLLLPFLAVDAASIAGLNEQKSERELKKFLFAEYDKHVRPVMIPSNRINVSASLAPMFLHEVDEKNQFIVMDIWITMNWKDEYLKWDLSSFGNTSILRLPSTEIWRPDLAFYTATPAQDIFLEPLSQVLIYPDGNVMWVPPTTIKSRCPLRNRATKNVINCNIILGSWTYSENEVDVHLTRTEVDISDFVDTNAEWKLLQSHSRRENKHYTCCKEGYPFLYFNFTFKKRNSFEENELLISEAPNVERVHFGNLNEE
ncbi:neuronal acetylcholine receptor subunit alpha-6-like [Stegodyphus dumicola]|uniref:neuronal acetylcholine receptor subunit alpha-6-like n=1 Tax=Stegodyphus dumicola TaxID=202533 RepID=UPI0015A9332D|nr:neuronal acetylcholine receptor subunit alpha-6-like [Stegodyphus dumicola]